VQVVAVVVTVMVMAELQLLVVEQVEAQVLQALQTQVAVEAVKEQAQVVMAVQA
jgi:hypothetical protein